MQGECNNNQVYLSDALYRWTQLAESVFEGQVGMVTQLARAGERFVQKER